MGHPQCAISVIALLKYPCMDILHPNKCNLCHEIIFQQFQGTQFPLLDKKAVKILIFSENRPEVL